MDKILTFALVALIVTAAPALADDATTVTVPYGDVISTGLLTVVTALGAAIVGAFRFLPPHVRWALTVFRVDQLIEKGLAHARAQIDSKLTPKTWTLDVRNKAIADALNYGINHYGSLVKQLGGSDVFRQKIEARLQEYIEKAVG